MREDGIKLGAVLLLAFVIALAVATVGAVGAAVADGLEGLDFSTTTTSTP